MRRRAFTLVELLVVIGIIGLLMGILLPAMARARAKAREAVCMSNMRQVGIALNGYVNDNRQTLPFQEAENVPNFGDENAPPTMLGSLLQYIGESQESRRVLACPVALPFEGASPPAPTERSETNILTNGALSARKIARIKNSSEVIIFQELSQRISIAHLRPVKWDGKWGLWHDSEVYVEPAKRGAVDNCSIVHDRVNPASASGHCVFVDGHVEKRTCRSLRSSEFALYPDERWSGTNTLHPDAGGDYQPLY